MIAFLARIAGVSPIVVEAVILGALLLAFAGSGVKIYDAGYAAADSKCEAAALQAQLDAVQKDRDDARAAAADATLKLAAVQAQTDTEKEKTDAYVAELEKRPAPSCALTDDDLRGMRASAPSTGAPRARPSGIAGWLNATRSGPAAKAR